MYFEDIKVNQKVELELENKNVAERFVRGLVLDKDDTDEKFVLIDEFGVFRTIWKFEILSLVKTNFDKQILDILYDYKKYYFEKKKHEDSLKELESLLPSLEENLRDARFLVNFNTFGAGVRLLASIEPSLLKFTATDLVYEIDFETNLNDQIEVQFIIKKEFEYHDTDEKNITEKLLAHYAPDKEEAISKIFKSSVTLKNKIIKHISDIQYYAVTEYSVFLPISVDNYLAQKAFVIDSILKLKRLKK